MVMPSDMAEVLITMPMTKLYNAFSKVLKDNQVITDDSH